MQPHTSLHRTSLLHRGFCRLLSARQACEVNTAKIKAQEAEQREGEEREEEGGENLCQI